MLFETCDPQMTFEDFPTKRTTYSTSDVDFDLTSLTNKPGFLEKFDNLFTQKSSKIQSFDAVMTRPF